MSSNIKLKNLQNTELNIQHSNSMTLDYIELESVK